MSRFLACCVATLACVSAEGPHAGTAEHYDGLAKISGSMHFLSTHLTDWVHPNHHDDAAVQEHVHQYKEQLMKQTGKLHAQEVMWRRASAAREGEELTWARNLVCACVGSV
jgi:hypothetical protein